MSTEQRLATAAERADKEPYKRDADGKLVDPLPVQKVAIEEGFKNAIDDPEFDIWSVVGDHHLREGDTVDENFRRVFEEWSDTLDHPDLIRAVERLVEEYEQEQDAEE